MDAETFSLPQAPMGTSWGDIEEGVRIEVPNSDISLPTKVYWIAEIVKLAGRTCQCLNVQLLEARKVHVF